MEEIVQNTANAVQSGMETARMISDVGMLIVAGQFYLVISVVVILYSMIQAKKDRTFISTLVEQTIKQNEKKLDTILLDNKNTESLVTQLLKSFDNNEFTKQYIVSDLVLFHCMQGVIWLLADIKENNHLEGNEKMISEKIKISMDTLRKKAESQLDHFSFNGVKLSKYLPIDVDKKIFEYIFQCVYDGKPYHRTTYFPNLKVFFDNLVTHFVNNMKNNITF